MRAPAAAPWPRVPAAGDVVVAVAALAAALMLVMGRPQPGVPDSVRVEVAGELVRRVPIDTTATLEVTGRLGPSTIRVEGRRARVVAAPCRHQVCIRRGWIDAAGEAVVCVPNQLVLRLYGGRGRPFDGVTR